MELEKKTFLILPFLAIATLLAFWQVLQCEFIDYDDNIYVTENRHIQNGITIEGLRWAFTATHAGNWHPLTWLSHMLDIQLFGLNPRGHHLTNLLFHTTNALLLFFVLHRMTRAIWQSAFVAALFALHPLHVESVAWVAERKDVLSAFFWMLTMGAYLSYVERPKLQRYLVVIVLFALGLMAKPMLVTLPLVLLLLDYWPLRRLESKNPTQEIQAEVTKNAPTHERKRKSIKKHTVAVKVEKPVKQKYQRAGIRPLLWEKIPLIVLALLSCVVTYMAQEKGGAVGSIEAFPLSIRIANAFVSYIEYVVKMLWPSDLAVLYPYHGMRPLWLSLGAALLFIAATFMAFSKARRFPYLTLGWLWYVGTLVPVIGFVQVGIQSRADRYTYIPLIGLFIIVAWGFPELIKGWRWRKEVLVASSALSLIGLFAVTWTQVGYWQNSITLFDHTLSVTERNSMIHKARGLVYSKLGNYNRAIADFDRAIEMDPKFALAYNGRAVAYTKLGNHPQAIRDFDRAIEIDPKNASARNDRGRTYGELGNHSRAIEDFNRAIEIDPKHDMAYYNRGIAYDRLGNHSRAVVDFDRAIEINPKLALAYNGRAVAYTKLGNHSRAMMDFNRAIEIDPEYIMVYYNRGIAYGNMGIYEQAYEDLKTAARLGSEDAKSFLRSHGIDWQKGL